MPRFTEKEAVENKAEAKPVEPQVQIITESQLINMKLDRIIEMLESEK